MKSICLIFFFATLNLSASTYYVRTNGNNSNGGFENTAGGAWLTIQKAADTMVAGDICRVQVGTYNERVAETTDGSAGNFITYIADGAVKVYGFNITGDYVRVIDFVVTHPSDLGYSGIQISSATGVELWHNTITNTSQTSVSPSAANNLLMRGNTMSYSGSPGNNNGAGEKSINDSGSPQTNVVIDYNNISHTTDFLCSGGEKYILRNNVLGPSSTNDFGGTPHVDGWQANVQTRFGWMEANWHINNSVTDSHMILIEAPVAGRSGNIAVIKNVSLRSGDHLWFQMRHGTNLHAAHNTVGQIGFGPRGGPGSSGFFYVFPEGGTNSTGNFSRNNIFTNVTTDKVYEITAGSDLTHDHDLVTPNASDITGGSNGDLETNPLFVDYANSNVALQVSSPCVDAGGALTTVSTASGTGTSFAVTNAYWFYDGFGLTAGMKIYVGSDNNLTVTAVDYATKTITVSASFTWANGENVGYAYLGSAPDMGALEYGAANLTAAEISNAGNDYTVTTTGDARFVVFYQNGIPHTTDYVAPYTATITSGTRTAKAYALHAQSTPVVTATAAGGGDPAPRARAPFGLKLRL